MGFLTVPAGLAFVALPGPIAAAVTFGQMSNGSGRSLVALSLSALGLGVVGHAALVLGTYGCYARDDTAAPFHAVLVRTVLAAGGMALAFAVPAGGAALFALGMGISVAELAGGAWLGARLRRGLPGGGASMLRPLLRAAAASALMVVPAYLVATRLPAYLPVPGRGQVAIVAATVTGAAVFLVAQRLWRSPELTLFAGGLRRRGAGAEPAR